jgi:hypothetical protein
MDTLSSDRHRLNCWNELPVVVGNVELLGREHSVWRMEFYAVQGYKYWCLWWCCPSTPRPIFIVHTSNIKLPRWAEVPCGTVQSVGDLISLIKYPGHTVNYNGSVTDSSISILWCSWQLNIVIENNSALGRLYRLVTLTRSLWHGCSVKVTLTWSLW